MTTEKINIPLKHQEFCKALACLCREHGMEKGSVTYTPNFDDSWNGDITMQWEQGRHGEESDKIFISSNIRVWTRLGPAKRSLI